MLGHCYKSVHWPVGRSAHGRQRAGCAGSRRARGWRRQHDPMAACGDLAASPFEDGRDGRGLADDQIFIDGAMAACEAALAADPQSQRSPDMARPRLHLDGRADRRRDAVAAIGQTMQAIRSRPTSCLASASGTSDVEGSVALLIKLPMAASPRPSPTSPSATRPATVLAATTPRRSGSINWRPTRATPLPPTSSAISSTPAIWQPPTSRVRWSSTTRAADLGEPLGNNGIGQLYEFGQGVDQDYAKAAEFYQLAADAGEKMSQTALAYLHEQGLGVPQDYDKSFALLTEASAQDWGFAQAALVDPLPLRAGHAGRSGQGLRPRLARSASRHRLRRGHSWLPLPERDGHGSQSVAAPASTIRTVPMAATSTRLTRYRSSRPRSPARRLPAHPMSPAASATAAPSSTSIPTKRSPPARMPSRPTRGPSATRSGSPAPTSAPSAIEDAVPLLEDGVAAGNTLAHVVLGDMLLAGSGVDAEPGTRHRALSSGRQRFRSRRSIRWVSPTPTARACPRIATQALHWLRLADSFGVTEAAAEIAALLSEGQGATEQHRPRRVRPRRTGLLVLTRPCRPVPN